MTTNLQKNPKKQFLGSKQAILQKDPNTRVLNNTTVQHLGNGDEPIEVFPPEIFFKGKFHEVSEPHSGLSRYKMARI